MGYKLLYAVIYIFSKLPFFILYGISNFVAFLLNHVIKYRKEVIIENLSNSFPEKSEEELETIRIEFTKNFSDQLVETLKMFTISKKDLEERFIIDNPEHFTKWVKENRSVMIAAGHFGNWEYPAGFPFTIPGFKQYNIIYAEISSKFFNQKVLDSRQKFGCHLIGMKNTMREISEHDKQGHVYGFIFDQSPHKGKVKYEIEFLNQTTPVHLGTELVSKTKNAVVIYTSVYRTKRGYYRMKSELVTSNPGEMKKYELTNTLFSKLERDIKATPALWLWSHRRWKYKSGIDYHIPNKSSK